MAPGDRTRQFRMNLSEQELTMLRDLARVEGLTSSDYLRRYIRAQYKTEHALTKAFMGSIQSDVDADVFARVLTTQQGKRALAKAEKTHASATDDDTKRRVRRRLKKK